MHENKSFHKMNPNAFQFPSVLTLNLPDFEELATLSEMKS